MNVIIKKERTGINKDGKDMVFGMKNKPSTPMKNVINYEYGNKAEKDIVKRYEVFIKKKERFVKMKPKLTEHFKKVMQLKRESSCKEIKPPFKMKMFKDIQARVKIPKVKRNGSEGKDGKGNCGNGQCK